MAEWVNGIARRAGGACPVVIGNGADSETVPKIVDRGRHVASAGNAVTRQLEDRLRLYSAAVWRSN